MKKLVVKSISIIAFYMGIWRLLYSVIGWLERKKILGVFAFHRVTDARQSRKYYMFYEKGIDAEIFEQQIKGICRYFEIIGIEEFIRIIKGEQELKKHSALLTFDDADYEFLKYVFPVLVKYNCQSVIFAPTGYIDTDKRFWHLRVSNIIANSDSTSWSKVKKIIEIFPPEIRPLILSPRISNEEERGKTCRDIVRILDGMNERTIESLLDNWEKASGTTYKLEIKCMSWDELRDLEKRKVRTESHTANHRKLAGLSREEIARELKDSKIELETQLNKTVTSLCYPAGSFNQDVVDVMGTSDYQVGFTSMPGICDYPLNGEELFRVPRFGMYGDNKYEIHRFLGRLAFGRIIETK